MERGGNYKVSPKSKEERVHELVEVFSGNGFPVLTSGYEEDDNNQFWLITPDIQVTFLINENDVVLAFRATTKPDVAAKIVLILSNLNYNVYISDVFYISSNGFYVGDEAYKAAEEDQIRIIMNEVNKQLMYLQILAATPTQPKSACC